MHFYEIIHRCVLCLQFNYEKQFRNLVLVNETIDKLMTNFASDRSFQYVVKIENSSYRIHPNIVNL